MLEIIRTTPDKAKKFESFFLPGVTEEPEYNESMIYLGIDDESSKVVSAAVVYPSFAGAKLLSIGVSGERINNGFGKEFLSLLKKDLKKVYLSYGDAFPRLMVEGCFEVDVWKGLGSFFEKCGFSLTGEDPVMLTDLSEIAASKMLQRVAGRIGDMKIVPLSQLNREVFKAFEHRVTTYMLYPEIHVDELESELTMFYLEDKAVRGCILMSSCNDDEYINDWVFLDERVKDRSIVLCMLAKCAEAGLELLPPDSKVWFIPTTKDGEQFMEKVVPSCTRDKEVRRYEMMFDQ